MVKSRLTASIKSHAVGFPQAGDIAVFRPRAATDLSALPKERVEIVQGFYPDYQAFAGRGFRCVLKAGTGYGSALVFLPRAKSLARRMIAQALAVTGGGPVIVDGQKTDGVDSILKDCRRQGGQVGEVFAKAHGKIFSLTGGNFPDWADVGPVKIAGGFVTDAGVFSADAVDRGSAMLAVALPAKLPGKIADLGAGWGYLSHHALTRDGARECHLIEAEHEALSCARLNVGDARARFHWADVRTFDAVGDFDHIVMNPPFHAGRAADPDIGRDFIAAAARLLRPRGTVWLVANRHLPYERHLSATFKEVAEVSGDASFKVFRAANPRPVKR